MRGDDAKRALAIAAVAMLFAGLLTACGGSGSSGSAQFADKTDSALLDFGEEASESELEAGRETVDRFLAARADADWETVCAELAQPMVGKLEHLAETSTGLEDTSCASFLKAFTRLSRQERSEREVNGGSLRHAGSHGYLIYEGAGEVVLAMPLEEEGGEWRVAAISAKPLS